MTAGELAGWLWDARRRTLELIEDLDDHQLLGPRLAIVNPLLWEIGHLAWFQERWVLRRAAGEAPLLPHADDLYDSSAVPHDTRWDLPLPSRRETLGYMERVLERVLDRLSPPTRRLGREERYFHLLSLAHEDMHDEAFAYTRQTLVYPAPRLSPVGATPAERKVEGPRGDVEHPGCVYLLGAPRQTPFLFDNEKWEHPVEVRPFAMARSATTQREFLAFVEDGGYRRPELWSHEGWRWRGSERAEHPIYWKREPGGRWLRRAFDRWLPLEDDLPVLHVNWFEVDAWCRWAGRRLPTEAEWEYAAAAGDGSAGSGKRSFPWGEESPGPGRANLDGHAAGCIEVDALPGGDTPAGCRQMLGNVWEWTASEFLPYPGFEEDPYRDYSRPWFGTHRVLRGGCWVTRSRLVRNTYRNFYEPHRRDVWAGFRTCALGG